MINSFKLILSYEMKQNHLKICYLNMDKINQRKSLKIIGSIFLALILLVIIGSFFISNLLNPIIDKKLKEGIARSSKELYHITYSDLSLNIPAGIIKIKELHLRNDSTIYRQLDHAKKAPNIIYDARANALTISGISFWRILLYRKINIGAIDVDSLSTEITRRPRPYNDDRKSNSNPYNLIKEQFNSIELGVLNAKGISVKLVEENNKNSNMQTVKNFDIKVEKFLLDENSGDDSTRVLYSKNISLYIPEFETNLADSPYLISLKNLKLSTEDKKLALSNLKVHPTLSLQSFAKQDKKNKPMIKLSIDSTSITGVNFNKLFKTRIFQADSAQLLGGEFDLAKDKRYQKDNVNKIGQSPAQQLMKIPFKFSIKNTKVKGIGLSYAQISDKYFREGKIDFKNIRGTINNVSNDSTVLNSNKNMTANLTGYVYGKGKLNALFTFDMLNPAGIYSYKGSLSAMNVMEFNRILEPLLNFRLINGNVEKILFDMHGTDLKNWGKFTFDYNHLKIEMLKSPNAGSGKKKILSFIANTFFINDSNPDANGKYHIGKVDYNRNPNHPFFKVIWKSLLEGIIQCTGTNPKLLPD